MATTAASSDVSSLVRSAFQDSLQALSQGTQGIEGLVQTSNAWSLATAFLQPRQLDGLNWNDRDHSGILPAFRWLADAEMTEDLLRHFYHDIEVHFYLVDKDVMAAVGKLETLGEAKPTAIGQILGELFNRLVSWQQAWAVPLAAFEDPPLRTQFLQYFVQTLHLHLPPTFSKYMHDYFALSFLAFSQPLRDGSLSPQYPSSPAIHPDKPSQNLHRLGMLARYGPEITSVAYAAVDWQVREECEGEWEERKLDSLRSWGRTVVGSWWERFYLGQENLDGLMKPIYSRIDYHVSKTLSDIRTTELFDIIVSYPDTLPALEDLKDCIAKVDSRTDVVNALESSNIKRLLHPGADTNDIMTQYVSTIRCLRIVDPPGVLLHRISEPIRRFLKNRPDTIRCIVASLIDDEEGDLIGEEEGGVQPLQVKDDKFDDYSDPNWAPEPIDAAPEFRSGKASDIISTLVSIYDSQDVIVKELQNLLAQKLLAVRDYDLEKEIRTIEILKLRFGEAALQTCEVMLKDLADSKRLNQRVRTEVESVIQPKIISRLFWPSFQSSALTLPGQLQAATAAYADAYHQVKPDKRLRWLPHLGTVDIKLELEDRTVELEVNLLQASVIELFGQQDTWNLADLSKTLTVRDSTTVTNALYFWVNQGVLRSSKSEGTWILLERREEGGQAEVKMHGAMEEDDVLQSTEADQAEQMRVYWQFIQGMLTSLDSMPTDRIQQMLGFAPGYDRTLEQLGGFMEALRREGVVERSAGGDWSLMKTS